MATMALSASCPLPVWFIPMVILTLSALDIVLADGNCGTVRLLFSRMATMALSVVVVDGHVDSGLLAHHSIVAHPMLRPSAVDHVAGLFFVLSIASLHRRLPV
jgi:hypothetical protein